MSNNLTSDLTDIAWPPTYSNPNVPSLDMNGNLAGLTSISTQTLSVNGASLVSTENK